MREKVHQTVGLGEVVAAAFDQAAQYSTDPEEVARLVTRAVNHFLRRRRRNRFHYDGVNAEPAGEAGG